MRLFKQIKKIHSSLIKEICGLIVSHPTLWDVYSFDHANLDGIQKDNIRIHSNSAYTKLFLNGREVDKIDWYDRRIIKKVIKYWYDNVPMGHIQKSSEKEDEKLKVFKIFK